MTTAGTWYYPPSAGTGGFLAHLSNPPFSMDNMDNTRTPSREFVQNMFKECITNGTVKGDLVVCSYQAGWDACERAGIERARAEADPLRQEGADTELKACCNLLELATAEWLRAIRRPEPTLQQRALARTTAILADCSIIIPDAVRDALTLSQQALIDDDNLDGN